MCAGMHPGNPFYMVVKDAQNMLHPPQCACVEVMYFSSFLLAPCVLPNLPSITPCSLRISFDPHIYIC